jgi:hypothetical protein
MKKRIYQNIYGKVISRENVIKLIDYFFNTYNVLKSEYKKFTLSFHTYDNEVYEIENTKPLIEDSVIDIKRIHSIKVSLIDYRNEKEILLNLTQGDDKWSNNLTLESKDEEWVNNQKIKLEDLIKTWTPQGNYYSKYKDYLLSFLSICVGLIIIRIMANTGSAGNENEVAEQGKFLLFIDKMIDLVPFTKYILLMLLSWIVGIFPVFFLMWFKIDTYLTSLWPPIEFDFGPEHYKYSKRKRKAIGLIITLIVIPILLNVFLGLIF